MVINEYVVEVPAKIQTKASVNDILYWSAYVVVKHRAQYMFHHIKLPKRVSIKQAADKMRNVS